MFKVRGKFYGKELRPFGNLALKALALAGYSNNVIYKIAVRIDNSATITSLDVFQNPIGKTFRLAHT